jgi:cytochrome c-type biogenesis protein
MLEDLLTWLTLAMTEQFGIALAASLAWGIASVLLSPCHLASIPLVIGYISAQGKAGQKHPLALSFAFAVGILSSIAVIGIVTASLGRMLGDVGMWGNIIVACVFFVVGLYLMELVNIPWGGFLKESPVAHGWTGALLLGFLFGIGLGPCTFAFLAPVLGLVFTLSTTSPLRALALLSAFALGHCGVIVFAGGTATFVQRYLKWTEGSAGARILKKAAGALVFIAGVYFLVTVP